MLIFLLRVISRSGYVVVDDSNRPTLDDSDWPWVVNNTSTPPDPAVCRDIPVEKVSVGRSRNVMISGTLKHSV